MIQVKDLTVRSRVYELARDRCSYSEAIVMALFASDGGLIRLELNTVSKPKPLDPEAKSFQGSYNDHFYCNKEEVQEQVKLGLQDELLRLRINLEKANKEYNDFIDTNFKPITK